MIKRVILFRHIKFSQRDYDRCGIEILKKMGYAVEVWVFNVLMRSSYIKNYSLPDPCDFNEIKYLNTNMEVQLAFDDLSDGDCIFDNSEIISKFDFEVSSKCLIGADKANTQPTLEKNKFFRLWRKLKNNPVIAILEIYDRITNRLRKPLKQLNRLDFVIHGGCSSVLLNQNIDNNTVVIKAHASDYDYFLKENSKCSNSFGVVKNKSRYAVFLDEEFADSHDLVYLGEKPYDNYKSYHHEINSFFDEFEKKTGLSIVVAGHPKSDYIKKGNPFNGRNIISGQTVALVKNADIVLAHGSRSLNYAVLYYKKTLLLDSISYTNDQSKHIRNMSRDMGVRAVLVTDKYDLNLDNIFVDRNKYDDYKRQYIKQDGTPEKHTFEIFCDYLDDLDSNNKCNS